MYHASQAQRSIALLPRSYSLACSPFTPFPRPAKSHSTTTAFLSTMPAAPVSPALPDAGKIPLKILMLHGYTQSGDLFRAKTRALEKHIRKSLSHHDVTLVYPTAPIALKPEDIPGFNSSTATDLEAFAWWRRSNTADPPLYTGLGTGLETIARVLTEQGPFDGIIGFSQGAACAAIVASLLEQPSRHAAFDHFSDPTNANTHHTTNGGPATQIPTGSAGGVPIAGIPFPAPFANIAHPPLKFAVCYSGFRAPGPRYRAFYERPPIATPIMHVLGSLDGIVDEGRSRALMAACEGDPEADGRVIFHPGGHFLPSQRVYLEGVSLFISSALADADTLGDAGTSEGLLGGQEKMETKKKDKGLSAVNVEDMDMPF